MRQEKIVRNVNLEGIRPILFDRYPGDNKTKLQPDEKFYRDEKGGLVIPSVNIQSFLCAQNTTSACKMFYDPRKYKKVAQYMLGFVTIEPFLIPILRNGKQLKFKNWDLDGIRLSKRKAMLKNGIPNPIECPVIDSPWSLKFDVTIWPNEEFVERDVKSLFEKGGIAIGLGGFRGVYGKFIIKEWK